MKFHLKKWIKSTLVLSLLLGASAVQADIMIKEQILDLTGVSGGNNNNAGGHSVAIDGEWAFVGNTAKCQTFVYKWDYLTYEWGDGAGGTGLAYTTLLDSGTACTAAGTDGFGQSISTDNGLVIVGAPIAKDGGADRYGKIHFFTFDETASTLPADANDTNRRGWIRQTTIGWPEDRNSTLHIVEDKQHEAEYGTSVSVRYDPLGSGKAILVIGAPGYDDPIVGADCGKIYVYEWDDTTNVALLINGQAGENAGDRVGTAVTSNGNELLVSAPGFDDNASGTVPLDSGAAYLFDYNTSTLLFALEHRIRSGGYDTPTNPVPPFGYGFTALSGTDYIAGDQIGLNLSYQGSTIALAGADTYLYDHNHSAGTFTFENKVSNTNGGDVTQSGNLINISEKGTSFNVYFDKTNLGTPPEANVTYLKSELDWGRDLSLSFPKLMVNGNGSNGSTDPKDEGVAYAYTPTCGLGGALIANQWQMIGLQCDITTGPLSTDTKAGIAEIFSESLGDYNTTWAMFRQPDGNYVGHQSDYVQMDANDTMKIGVGYWIISINDVKFQVNNVGLSTNPIYGHHPTKQLDPLTRPLVGGVTKLDVKAMMGGASALGRGDVDLGGTPHSDFRVMFSNPLNAPTDWVQAIMGETTAVKPFDLVSGYSGWFDSGAAVAWIYNPADNWYIVAAPVPGLTQAIMPGQGFRILFNGAFYTEVLSNASVPTLELDLTDLK